jgi:phosphoesterase RecJ-like protein
VIKWDEVGARLDGALEGRKGIVLSTHVNPDGDGLGSEIGLYHHLKARGHQVSMINNDPVPAKYRFMSGASEILVYDGARCRDLILGAGLFFVLDNSSPERLGRLLADVQASKAYRICIDHHTIVDPFWNLNCVDVDACASGQLVYEAIRALGGKITPGMAEAIYVAFVTDTGHFRFSKTTARVHRIIAELMETGGINPPKIYRALFEGVSPGLNRLIAFALADAHYEYGGRFAWARLTQKQLEECDGFEEDTSDLVNMLLSVEGVVASALIKEFPSGKTKVSLRSLGEVNINRLAVRLGGGGHVNASGAVMTAPLEEGVRRVVDGMKEVLEPA